MKEWTSTTRVSRDRVKLGTLEVGSWAKEVERLRNGGEILLIMVKEKEGIERAGKVKSGKVKSGKEKGRKGERWKMGRCKG